jgi:hypothetical protein
LRRRPGSPSCGSLRRGSISRAGPGDRRAR